jgi:hypothetical protein
VSPTTLYATVEDTARPSAFRAVWYWYVLPYSDRSFKDFDIGRTSKLDLIGGEEMSVLAYG